MRKYLATLLITLVLFVSLAGRASAVIIPGFDYTQFPKLGEANNFTLGITELLQENMATSTASWVMSILLSLFNLIGSGFEEGGKEINLPGGEGSYYNPYIHGGGALGTLLAVNGSFYDNPPTLQPVDYIQNSLANNIFNTQPAYAQGTGGEILSSDNLLALWKAFRNISYYFIVVVLVMFGFMIMFRYQIDPRTVATVQMAIPRVILSLVLITFSFALAGLIIDLGRVGTGLVQTILGDLQNVSVPAPYAFPVQTRPSAIFTNFTLGPMHFNIGGLSVSGASTLPFAEILFQVTVRLATFFIMFAIFWTIVVRYAQLFIQALIGPFSLLWGALPGQGEHATRWIKGMLVNTLVFPGIYLVVNIAQLVQHTANLPLPEGFVEFNPTGGAGGGGTGIEGLVAIGVLAVAPKIPAILEDILQVTPSGHVAKAGVTPTSVMKSVPVVGRLLGG